MRAKQFARYLDRDLGCVHCGETETVSPHHRANRGMGGSKIKDNPANVVVMCSQFNSLMESDEAYANIGRLYGWKLRPWESATDTPLWHRRTGTWRMLRDDFTFETLHDYIIPAELRDYF